MGRIRSMLVDPRIVRTLVLFVSVAVLLYLAAIFLFGWQDTATALAHLGAGNLLLGAGIASTSYLWRFGRWEYSLRRFGHRVPRRRHLAIYLSGLALTATPGKSGEAFRSALLLQQGVRVSHSLANFIVDRATDLLGMCLLGLLAAVMTGQRLAWLWALGFATLLSGSCIFAYLLLHPRSRAWWNWIDRGLKWLPIKGGQAVLESWAMVWQVPRVSAYSVVATVAYGTQALVFAWFCQLADTGLSTATCVLIFVQATLFGAASMIPAGLGAMEAALVIQMTEQGVGDGVALSLAISIRLVTLWLGMALGAIALLIAPSKDSVHHSAQ